jgi:lysophospholipase L1-like esterase
MNLRKILVVVVAIGIGLAIYSFLKPTHYRNLPPTATGEWIAFGDSLTAGNGASAGNDYPALLSQRLGVPIRNLGVPGDTTAAALGRIDTALATPPRVVLLCLGGNDGLMQLPVSEMIGNLSRIIDAFQGAGSFVILIGVHSASLRDGNAEHFEALAKEKQTFYVPDILDGVLSQPSLMSDQVHPNDAGYAAIATRLEELIRPLMGRL